MCMLVIADQREDSERCMSQTTNKSKTSKHRSNLEIEQVHKEKIDSVRKEWETLDSRIGRRRRQFKFDECRQGWEAIKM